MCIHSTGFGWRWAVFNLIKVSAILIAVSGCSPFKAAQISLSSSSLNSETSPLIVEGKTLYAQSCASCHGSLEQSTKSNRQPEQILAALGTVEAMRPLKSLLSSAQINAIAAALALPSTPLACSTSAPLSKTTIRRLNLREYTNSVRDLFEDQTLTINNYPQALGISGFDTQQDAIRTYSADVPKLLTLAESLTEQMRARPASLLNSCGATGKTAQQTACAKALVQKLARRAYRRTPAAAELAGLNAMIDSSTDARHGLSDAFASMVMAPQFLFHIVDYTQNRQGALHTLGAFELASRMSYLIWSSLPDDELLRAASAGELGKPETLKLQVRRLVASNKADQFILNFTKQWLGLKGFDSIPRSAANFPEMTQSLRDAMVNETLLLFQDLFRRDQPVDSALTADHTFANQELAAFYGLPFAGTSPNQFAKHSLSATGARRGFLSHASVMTMTSAEARTSPIKRGHFMVDRVLCQPPGEPPAGVAENFAKIDPALPPKERYAIHRNNSSCIGCHAQMDPLGFAFENFDPIGRVRTTYPAEQNFMPVDTSDRMPDGFQFAGSRELATWVATGSRFEKCLNKSISSYAVGRYITDADLCRSNSLVETLIRTNPSPSFADMIEALVMSELFQKSQVQE